MLPSKKPWKSVNTLLRGFLTMSKKKRFGVSQALTRGLSETINVVENNTGIFRNVILPLSRIELDPDNPRKLAITLSDVVTGLKKNDPATEQKIEELARLQELATTIETSGVINPIVVYKRGEFYRVVAGERRSLASILAGKNEIEARVFNEKPKGFELKLLQWVENTAREDLSLAERIDNMRDIISEYNRQYGQVEITGTLLKNITGLSLSQTTYYLQVINAPEDIKTAITNKQIRSLDKAAVLASISAAPLRTEALQHCITGCSLKDLRSLISKGKSALKKSSAITTTPKRGRAVSRINMGVTSNPQVIQLLVNSVLQQREFKKYSEAIAKVNWDNLENTNRAFKKLIEIIEHEIAQ
jgi:ParB family chromosome partitioning protein